MGQLTVYIDDATLKRIGSAAKKERTSVSSWVKKRLEESLNKGWPKGYLEWLGSLSGIDIEAPKDIDPRLDRPREKL